MTEQESQLTQALIKQVEQLSSLAVLLEKELQLISSRDAESLMNLLDEKTALLTSIQALDGSIERTISDQGSMSEEDEALMTNAKNHIIASLPLVFSAFCQYVVFVLFIDL